MKNKGEPNDNRSHTAAHFDDVICFEVHRHLNVALALGDHRHRFLKFDAPGSMGIVTLIAAVAPVAHGFITKNGRAMSKGERISFATLGTIFSVLASLIVYAGFLKFSGVELSVATLNEVFGTTEIPWGILAAILAFALVIGWLVLYFSTGWMCRGAMKRLSKS